MLEAVVIAIAPTIQAPTLDGAMVLDESVELGSSPTNLVAFVIFVVIQVIGQTLAHSKALNLSSTMLLPAMSQLKVGAPTVNVAESVLVYIADIPMQLKDPNIFDALRYSKLTMHCDNEGALKLPRNPVFHAHTKHIEVHHHFIWESVLEGEICLKYISTSEQPANVLTKALSCMNFELHRDSIGVIKLSHYTV
ncbi:unnamed protein product [Calypogeia fissa]